MLPGAFRTLFTLIVSVGLKFAVTVTSVAGFLMVTDDVVVQLAWPVTPRPPPQTPKQ